MLRNKYFIAGIGILLLTVVFYNISFFLKRRGATRLQNAAVQNIAVSVGKSDSSNSQQKAAAYRPEWRRDPFWYSKKPQQLYSGARQLRSRTEKQGPRLEGTMIKDGKGYALINGRVCGVGDKVAGYEIIKIDGSSVTVKGTAGTRILRIISETAGKE